MPAGVASCSGRGMVHFNRNVEERPAGLAVQRARCSARLQRRREAAYPLLQRTAGARPLRAKQSGTPEEQNQDGGRDWDTSSALPACIHTPRCVVAACGGPLESSITAVHTNHISVLRHASQNTGPPACRRAVLRRPGSAGQGLGQGGRGRPGAQHPAGVPGRGARARRAEHVYSCRNHGPAPLLRPSGLGKLRADRCGAAGALSRQTSMRGMAITAGLLPLSKGRHTDDPPCAPASGQITSERRLPRSWSTPRSG